MAYKKRNNLICGCYLKEQVIAKNQKQEQE